MFSYSSGSEIERPIGIDSHDHAQHETNSQAQHQVESVKQYNQNIESNLHSRDITNSDYNQPHSHDVDHTHNHTHVCVHDSHHVQHIPSRYSPELDEKQNPIYYRINRVLHEANHLRSHRGHNAQYTQDNLLYDGINGVIS